MYVCVFKGLDKLMEASESVAKLSQDLAVKEKELAVASMKADEVSLHFFVTSGEEHFSIQKKKHLKMLTTV